MLAEKKIEAFMESPSNDEEIYELNTVTYGTTSVPFLIEHYTNIEAYSTCMHVKGIDTHNSSTTGLICAKSKLAPRFTSFSCRSRLCKI
ncbi:hypothetical protein Trydic_g16268 [Trypoxylus dichotomus]